MPNEFKGLWKRLKGAGFQPSGTNLYVVEVTATELHKLKELMNSTQEVHAAVDHIYKHIVYFRTNEASKAFHTRQLTLRKKKSGD